jgi:membrane associated rhomboid family serine protease
LRKIISLIAASVVSSFIYWNSREMLTHLLGFSGKSFFQGNFWTVFTALFIHEDLMHLVGNIIFLYVFGGTLEDEIGSVKTISTFFIGGVSSFIFSTVFYGFNTVMIGASAAIFTLTAIVMLTKPLKFSWFFFMPLGLVAILYFVYNIASALHFGGVGNVGYLAHIIGFVVGFPFGVAFGRKRWMRNLLISIALLIAYCVILSSFLPLH